MQWLQRGKTSHKCLSYVHVAASHPLPFSHRHVPPAALQNSVPLHHITCWPPTSEQGAGAMRAPMGSHRTGTRSWGLMVQTWYQPSLVSKEEQSSCAHRPCS